MKGMGMLFARDGEAPAFGTQSLIGAGMVITGDIRFSGGLRIDGKVVGNVRCVEGQQGALAISEKGCVEGNIEVARQLINGMVTGRVEARDFVRLQPKARVTCDIAYGTVEIQPGAVLDGCLMLQAHRIQVEDPQETFQPTEMERAAAPA